MSAWIQRTFLDTFNTPRRPRPGWSISLLGSLPLGILVDTRDRSWNLCPLLHLATLVDFTLVPDEIAAIASCSLFVSMIAASGSLHGEPRSQKNQGLEFISRCQNQAPGIALPKGLRAKLYFGRKHLDALCCTWKKVYQIFGDSPSQLTDSSQLSVL